MECPWTSEMITNVGSLLTFISNLPHPHPHPHKLIDEELATQMQFGTVHEPKQTMPEERCEPEQLHAIDEVIESMLASLAEDRTDC